MPFNKGLQESICLYLNLDVIANYFQYDWKEKKMYLYIISFFFKLGFKDIMNALEIFCFNPKKFMKVNWSTILWIRWKLLEILISIHVK